jgi:2-methylcitrate dehydratase PrpD
VGVTSRLAGFAVNTTFEDLPAPVVAISKEMMLNAAGIGLAGSEEREGQIITEYVKAMGGRPASTVIGASFRSSPESAALANGTMVHVLDFDENVERRANHPSNAMFPTVMAIGEHLGCSGQAVTAAFAVGCEVSTKLGAAGDLDAQFPRISGFGWHPQGVTGTFGATAAAGKLLGLDQAQMENAFGLACSQAAGLQVNFATSSKSLHPGSAAMRGIMCATLAQKGFTGARNGIEGERGFFEAYRRDRNLDDDEFIERLGTPYDVIDPGLRLKIYPCGSLAHVSLEAILYLVGEHKIQYEQVQAIRVSVPRRWGLTGSAITHPQTGLEGKFSMAYCMAVAVVYGTPQLQHFTDQAVRDPKLVSLLDKVTVVTDEVPTATASRPSTVTITLNDGREVSRREEYAKGDRHKPVTAKDIDDKFATCSHHLLGPELMKEVILRFRTLDEIRDVRPLFASLAVG